METINTPEVKPQKQKSIVRTIAFLPQVICCSLFGENHPVKHRIIAGLVIAIGGVILNSIIQTYFQNELIKLSGETVGMGFHGIGLTPIIERMAKKT